MDRNPEIAAIEPTVFLWDGVGGVRVTQVGALQATTASLFYRALAKRG